MDSFTQFDGNLLIGIQHALNADWLTPVMKFITMFGEGGFFWIAACLVMLVNGSDPLHGRAVELRHYVLSCVGAAERDMLQ